MKNAVLCISRDALQLKGDNFYGVYPVDLKTTPANAYHFLNRQVADASCEKDPRFFDIAKALPQILGYVVVRKEGKILTYSRKKGAEERLHGSRSVGIGGHADISDVTFDSHNFIDSIRTLKRSVAREVREELGWEISYKSIVLDKMLVDTSNDVGKVHVGALIFLDLPDNADLVFDEELFDPVWKTLPELEAEISLYENWSQIVIHSLSTSLNQ